MASLEGSHVGNVKPGMESTPVQRTTDTSTVGTYDAVLGCSAIQQEHWLMRVQDGKHFWSSSKHNVWGITGTNSDAKHFKKHAKVGDILWFLGNKSRLGGKIIGVATFEGWNTREVGPLLAITRTNEELGWTERDGNWDTEVHYKDLYDLSECNDELIPNRLSQSSIHRYTFTKCLIDLPQEHKSIVKYCKAKKM